MTEPLTTLASPEAFSALLARVEAMVAASSAPADFNARAWLTRWLDAPLPALGGQRPAEALASPNGLAVVTNVLETIQAGVYV